MQASRRYPNKPMQAPARYPDKPMQAPVRYPINLFNTLSDTRSKPSKPLPDICINLCKPLSDIRINLFKPLSDTRSKPYKPLPDICIIPFRISDIPLQVPARYPNKSMQLLRLSNIRINLCKTLPDIRINLNKPLPDIRINLCNC